MNAYSALTAFSTMSPRMNPWNWVLHIAGVILSAVSLGLAIAGTVLMISHAAQRDG